MYIANQEFPFNSDTIVCSINSLTAFGIQWNPSIVDTLGT